MPHLITVTEAVRTFSDILGRVYYKGDEFDIKKGGQVIAHIGPAKNRTTLKMVELNSFFKSCPKLIEDDVVEFEKDINFIRSSAGEIQDKWD